MNKRTGYVVGLVLLATGIGVPAVVVAADDDTARTAVIQTRDREAVPGANDTWENADQYGRGVDPFGGVIERDTPWSAEASSASAATDSETSDGANRRATQPTPEYGVGLAELNAYGVDPYGGFVEPGADPLIERAGATYGLTSVEPSALGVSAGGGLVDEAYVPGSGLGERVAGNAAAGPSEAAMLAAEGVFVDADGVVRSPLEATTQTSSAAAVADEYLDWSWFGFDPYGGFVEPAWTR